MDPTPRRGFTSPLPGEDWKALAARILPGEPAEDAVEKLRSWNLHLFARNPPGEFTGSDVLFIEPPQEDSGFALPRLDGGFRER